MLQLIDDLLTDLPGKYFTVYKIENIYKALIGDCFAQN